jgi:hypothetical protein
MEAGRESRVRGEVAAYSDARTLGMACQVMSYVKIRARLT